MTPGERERFLLEVLDALSTRRIGMMKELEAKADQATAEAEQAVAEAAQAAAKAEQAGLRKAIVALLEARKIPFGDEVRARISCCDDVPTLERWLSRATTAATAAEVLES